MITQLPYPGLRPFQSHESDIFFGREAQIDDLLRKLGSNRFLAVTGPSGCGKSSLVLAGMIPALRTGFMVSAGSRWQIAVARPGSQPFANLGRALAPVLLGEAPASQPGMVEFLTATLSRGPLGVIEALRESPLPEQTNLLLIVDQFEELFRFRRLNVTGQADAFVALLLESARQQVFPVYIVTTMRSDYFGECALFMGLPEALNQGQYLTPRMSRGQRRAVIVSPARVFGGDVEPDVLNRLINESGSNPDNLPVLQHVLMRMWAHAAPCPSESQCSQLAFPTTAAEPTLVEPDARPRKLAMADYDAVGGFTRAISQHAEEAFGELTATQQKVAELMFRRMCERTLRDFRRPIALAEAVELVTKTIPNTSEEDVVAVADVFRKPSYGFVMPPYPQPLSPSPVDITHESLISRWERLSRWVDQEADSARTYAYIWQAADRWNHEQGALWGTPDLDNALKWQVNEKPNAAWASRYEGDFSVTERFISESRAERDRRRAEVAAERKRRLRTARLLGAVFAVLSVCAVSALFYVYEQSRRAVSRELAAVSVANLDLDPERSAWLSLHALNAEETPEARDAIQRAVYSCRAIKTFPSSPASPVHSVAFNGDGKKLVTGYQNGIIRIWDLASGQHTDYDDHSGHAVVSLAYNPRRDVFASVGQGSIHIHELANSKEIELPKTETQDVTRVAFSPTGDLLAAAREDGRIRIYDSTTGQAVYSPIVASTTFVWDVAFHPDGTKVAGGDEQGNWGIWDLNGKNITRVKGESSVSVLLTLLSSRAAVPRPEISHTEPITSIAFNHSGSLIATASMDRTVRIWDAANGKLLQTLRGHASDIRRVAFSPDDTRLLSASSDMTAKLWDVTSGRTVSVLHGHSSPVSDAVFGPGASGTLIATGGDDGTVRVWEVPPGHTDQVYAVGFSPDGKRIATGSRDWTMRLWNVPAMQPEGAPMLGHFGSILTLDFHPKNNDLVLTGGDDTGLVLWDLGKRKPVWRQLKPVSSWERPINCAIFDPQGERIVSGGDDRNLTIRDIAGQVLKNVDVSYSIHSLAFRPGSDRLLAVGINSDMEGKVLFYDTETWNPRTVGIEPSQKVGLYGLAFSPDGRLLATAGADNKASLWNLETHQLERSFDHEGTVAGLAFSSDGRLLATASWDQTARIWDVHSGKQIRKYMHPAAVNAIRFSRDDKYVATACDDFLVRLIPLDPRALREMARSRLTHEPSPEDCQKYLHKAVCPKTPM